MSLASLLHSSSTIHHTHHRSSQIDPKTIPSSPYSGSSSSSSASSSSSSSTSHQNNKNSSTTTGRNNRRNKPRYAQDTFTSIIRRKNIENNRSKRSTPDSVSSWDGNNKQQPTGNNKKPTTLLWSHPVSPGLKAKNSDPIKKQQNSDVWDEESLQSCYLSENLLLSSKPMSYKDNVYYFDSSKPPVSTSSDKSKLSKAAPLKSKEDSQTDLKSYSSKYGENSSIRSPYLVFQSRNDSHHYLNYGSGEYYDDGGKFKRNDIQFRSFVSNKKSTGGFQRTYSYREPQNPTATIKSSLAYQILPSSTGSLLRSAAPMTDPEGHLIFQQGDVLCSRYRIINSLGEGTFGRVVKVRDLKHHTYGKSGTYALKIVKNIEKYRLAARLEINVLKALSKDAGHPRIVKYFDSFDYYGHKCLLFEVLGESIFEFLKSNSYSPYPISQVQHISFQLISAISFLHELKITHTDLKPENILFLSSDYYYVRGTRDRDLPLIKRMRDTRIKLIDFGSATFEWEHHSSIVSTRHYRAPEVILELGWGTPCDIWSIGCIVFELWRGHTLFQTHSNREHLAMMETALSRRFPLSLSLRSPSKYFDPSTGVLIWDPRSSEADYVRRHVFVLSQHVKNTFLTPRNEIQIIDLIVKCLEFDPELRVKAEGLARHPFFDAMPLESRDLSEDFHELKI